MFWFRFGLIIFLTLAVGIFIPTFILENKSPKWVLVLRIIVFVFVILCLAWQIWKFVLSING